MIIIYICTIIDEDIDYSLPTFLKKIKSVLLDKRGWQSHNYKFKFVSPTFFNIISKSFPDENSLYKYKKIKLRLSTNKTITNQCKFDEKEKLSCFDPTNEPSEVLINLFRWQNGSSFSGLNLNDYRTYVVNHEIGHALGRGHVIQCNDTSKKVPVMMQQTISIGKCIPNPWPLDFE